MSIDTIPTAKRSITRSILLGFVAFLSMIVIIVVGFVLFLPKIISTEWFRGYVETQASKTLHRPVQIKRLSWKWEGEIRAEGISIADLPVFSEKPMCSISKAVIQVDLKKILERRLVVNLMLSDMTIQLIRDHNGQTNLEKFLFPLTQPASPEPEKSRRGSEKKSIKFPVDVQATGRFNNITLRIDDQQTGRRLALEKMVLQLAMPSLYSSPITLDISSDLKLEGHQIPSLRLNSKINGLFDTKGTLDLTHALFDVNGVFPGAQFTINHDPVKKETKARVQIHLSELKKVLFPFIPPLVSATQITGKLEFVLNANGNPMELFSFDTHLAGYGVGMSGGVIPNKRLGPFDFSLSNTGDIEVTNGTISIQKGSLYSLGKSRILWRGIVAGFNQPTPTVDMVIGPVWIDLEKLFALVRAFIPKEIPFSFRIDKKAPILKIKDARFSGPFPSGPNRIEINDLTLTIPGGLKYNFNRFSTSSFSAENLRFTVGRVESIVEDGFPKNIDLSASIQVDNLKITGEKNVYIKALEIPHLRIKGDEIHPSKTSPFGFTSQVELQESIVLNELKIPGFITINNATQQLDATWTQQPETGIDLELKNFHMTIPSLVIQNKRLAPFQAHSDLTAAATRIHIDRVAPLKASVSGLTVSWVLDNLLELGIKAEITDLSSALLKTEGKLAVDLKALYERFLKKRYQNNNLTGDVAFRWRFSGRIPTVEELRKLEEKSKFDMKNDFNFIDKLGFSSTLKGVGIDWTFTDDRQLKIGAVSTPKPLRYEFEKISGIGKVTGNLLIENIDTIPLEILKHPIKSNPLSINLSFSGEHQYLKSFSFSQVLDLTPFNIKETLNLSLYGLDRIAKKDLASPLPILLQRLGGTARGTLSFQGGNAMNRLINDLTIEGKMVVGGEIQLTPGQRIDIKSWINTSKMGVDIGSNFSIKNLQADLNLEKSFYIAHGKAENKAKTPSLSVDVLKKGAPLFSSEFKDSTLQRLMNQLRKRFNPKHAISFESARLGVLSNPIKIHRSFVDVDLTDALPRVDYFQADLLGGTVIGSILILDQNPGFLIQTRLSFSGLDAKNLLSRTGEEDENEDRSISGELFLSFPLTVKLQPLLQELNFDLKFSHIGSRSLEGFLYLIDPSESNETIASQRRLLRIGTPKWIELTIKNGILSLYGEVEVKGILIKIPPLERLNIGNLPGLADIEGQLNRLGPIIELFDIYTKNTLKIGYQNKKLTLETRKR